MADKFPGAEVYYNDLSATIPDWRPNNLQFLIDDVESEWIDRKFDFIHGRSMGGSIRD